MIKHVLITGANGFLGRQLATQLSLCGMHVTGIGRGILDDWKKAGVASWYACDVTIESLRQLHIFPDVIMHCAGGASVGASLQDPYHDFKKTVETTAQVLEFVRLFSPRTKVVYPSSAAVYGQAKELPIHETAVLKPISPYGVHKLMAEELCQSYAHHFGISIAIVRLFSIYGSELRKQLLWDACNKFEKGDLEFFGSGEEIRDWLYIDDAVSLLALAAEHATNECPVLNGGAGQGVSIREIIDHLRSELGLESKPVFSSRIKAGDPSAYVAEMSIAKQWGWTPRIDWRTGVSRYAKWYLEQRF